MLQRYTRGQCCSTSELTAEVVTTPNQRMYRRSELGRQNDRTGMFCFVMAYYVSKAVGS